MGTIETILLSVLGIIAGSLLLYFGADGLVKGSASMAIRKGIAPLVIGLTIVAFGTSSPELVVSVSASIKGNMALSFGNILGSNICNIALILGIAALIRPIKVSLRVVKIDIMIMIGITLIFILMVLIGNNLTRFEGLLLFLGIIIYTFLTIKLAKKEFVKEEIETSKFKKPWVDIILIIGGLIILVLGANLFLQSAVEIAKILGASDMIIGLTIVAVGTSLPELATTVVAAIKKEGGISIGNIIGSNIFNILCILGIAALITPVNLTGPDALNPIDIIMLIIVSIILLPLAWTKLEISRLEGVFLLILYFGYLYYLYTFRLTEVASSVK